MHNISCIYTKYIFYPVVEISPVGTCIPFRTNRTLTASKWYKDNNPTAEPETNSEWVSEWVWQPHQRSCLIIGTPDLTQGSRHRHFRISTVGFCSRPSEKVKKWDKLELKSKKKSVEKRLLQMAPLIFDVPTSASCWYWSYLETFTTESEETPCQLDVSFF